MTTTPLHKRAFVRGLNAELIRTGVAAYPTKVAADFAADYVADNSGMPDPFSSPQSITLKVAHALCTELVKASKVVTQKLGGATVGLAKTAAAADPMAWASDDALAIMQKVAAEVETPNTLNSAAETSWAADQEKEQRPEGYAVAGMGNYEDKGKGAVGEEDVLRGGASNSVVENSKAAAALSAALLKGASDYLDTPQLNTLTSAASTSAAAAMEAGRRPESYAVTGVGNTSFTAPASAVIGTEVPATPSITGTGSNSVMEFGKAAQAQLIATAQKVAGYLPRGMSGQHKIAHIRAMAPLSVPKQAAYLEALYSNLGAEKTAAANVRTHFLTTLKKAEEDLANDMAIQSALEAAESAVEKDIEEDKSEGGEKSESKEEKKEESPEEAKEASLRAIAEILNKHAQSSNTAKR